MGISEELERLNSLREKGALSEAEYEQAKASALKQDQTAGQAIRPIAANANSWAMLIHLTQLCGIIIPFAGWLVPLVLWLMKKDESDVIDAHGKIVMNWVLSAVIYSIVSGLLCIILVGIFMLAVLGILCLVFPIIGAVKASSGEYWPYPLSIQFFK